MQLTEQFHIPAEHHETCDRLAMLVQKHTRWLLTNEYRQDHHLDAFP